MRSLARSCGLAAVLLLSNAATAWATGPSFDCNSVQTAQAQFICASPDLSQADLEFVQAYYALRQQLGPAGWQALKQEDIDFQHQADVQCGIAPSGTLPPDATALTACLEQGYTAQRAKWLSRLSGAALAEASRPIELHIALQRDLQSLGFLPHTASIDGVYGTATRSAILAWQRSRRLPETGFLAANEQSALESQAKGWSLVPTATTTPTIMKPLARADYDGKQAATLQYQDILVTVDSEPSQDAQKCGSLTDCRALVATGSYRGRPAFNLRIDGINAEEIGTGSAVEVRHLDPATSIPQVLLYADSHGAHCCVLTRIATADAIGIWHALDPGDLDGSGYRFMDLDSNGSSVLVSSDNAFLYAFSSYAGSRSPTRIAKLVGAALMDVTKSSRYRGFLRQELRRMEADQRLYGGTEVNGYLAGWVAQKSLIGELDEAWKTMLASYDHNPTLQLDGCTGGGSQCSFPEALSTFLVRNGYLTPDESNRLAAIPAVRAPTSWFVYNADKSICESAATWAKTNSDPTIASPAAFISAHRFEPWYKSMHIERSPDGSVADVEITTVSNGKEFFINYFSGYAVCQGYVKYLQDKGAVAKPGELQ